MAEPAACADVRVGLGAPGVMSDLLTPTCQNSDSLALARQRPGGRVTVAAITAPTDRFLHDIASSSWTKAKCPQNNTLEKPAG